MNELLKTIINSPTLYARFLNTFSLLEYIGARKILKSQEQQHLTSKLLAHISEEIRHAQILKRAAVKISPVLCETYAPEALLCSNEAYTYFQAVDHAAGKILSEYDSWHCYLYTTFLIEIRATTFYSAVATMLQELGKPNVFRGILVEEERHLQEVSTWLNAIPNHEKNLQQLKDIEEKEFATFLSAIEQYVCGEFSTEKHAFSSSHAQGSFTT